MTTPVDGREAQELREGATKYGLALSDIAVEKFLAFLDLVYEWNEKLNLTSIDRENAVRDHLLDSLSLLKARDFTAADNVIDIGTGAGFPGIPLAIACPETHFVLLDSLQKRCDFVSRAVRKLALHNVEVHHARAEQAGRDPNFREAFSIAVARAVAPLSLLAELLLPFVQLQGIALALKGERVESELRDAETILRDVGGVLQENLHVNETKHILVLEKRSPTPDRFPRLRAR